MIQWPPMADTVHCETRAHADLAPQVSVVVPVSAAANPVHLREALDSVAAQRGAEWECVIVLDGPAPEALRETVTRRCAGDHRFRRIELPSAGGPARARNAGIAEARGAYIALLDADDRAAPERLSRQAALLDAGQADICGSAFRVIDEAGNARGFKSMPLGPHAIRRAMPWFNPIANSSVCARAAVLRAHPFRESHGRGHAWVYGEDYDLWVTLALAGFRFVNAPEALIDYRAGAGFLERRRGWTPFRTDLATKIRARRLYPRWLRLPVILLACPVAALRLLPAPMLRPVYWLRSWRLRRGAGLT